MAGAMEPHGSCELPMCTCTVLPAHRPGPILAAAPKTPGACGPQLAPVPSRHRCAAEVARHGGCADPVVRARGPGAGTCPGTPTSPWALCLHIWTSFCILRGWWKPNRHTNSSTNLLQMVAHALRIFTWICTCLRVGNVEGC